MPYVLLYIHLIILEFRLTLYNNIYVLELHQRVAGIAGDSTLVVLVPGHLDVSVLSPLLTPAKTVMIDSIVFCIFDCIFR